MCVCVLTHGIADLFIFYVVSHTSREQGPEQLPEYKHPWNDKYGSRDSCKEGSRGGKKRTGGNSRKEALECNINIYDPV